MYPSGFRLDERNLIYVGPVLLGRLVDGGIQFFDRHELRAYSDGDPFVSFRDLKSFVDRQAAIQKDVVLDKLGG